MPRDASELSRRLARDAEAVCRHYLPNGRRQGRYWTVGDIRNASGRSMFVRLSGPDAGPGAAGHWTDAASAEYGDLLDVIRESCGLIDFRDVAEEARRFLHDAGALRYHPRCYYRPDDGPPAQKRPAMIAAVTDLDGKITGAHRTWLAPDGFRKAAVDTPRRAIGGLLGHAVRFGAVDDVLAVGEGIETMLSLRLALPAMPMAAALSANHLCRPSAAVDTAQALHRPRCRRRGRHGARGIDRTRGSSGHRGVRPVSEAGRLQRGPASLRPRRAASGTAPTARTPGCRAIHPRSGGDSRLTDGGSELPRSIR
jgi:hypothetical protein